MQTSTVRVRYYAVLNGWNCYLDEAWKAPATAEDLLKALQQHENRYAAELYDGASHKSLVRLQVFAKPYADKSLRNRESALWIGTT
jgi:hypothetical protein